MEFVKTSDRNSWEGGGALNVHFTEIPLGFASDFEVPSGGKTRRKPIIHFSDNTVHLCISNFFPFTMNNQEFPEQHVSRFFQVTQKVVVFEGWFKYIDFFLSQCVFIALRSWGAQKGLNTRNMLPKAL